jgi:hypothetical protein
LYSEDAKTFIETKEGRQGYVEAIEFHPNMHYVATGSSDQ